MALLAAISTGPFVFDLVIGLVVGYFAYRSSEKFKWRNNVTPWHIPSLVWGLIGFLSLLLCVILLLIARRTTKPVAISDGAPTAATPAPPPGWYPDPMSEHEFRFWDGSQWTDRVEDGGLEHAADS
jgi:Protein of unknown function (DUF2510)